MGDNFSQKPKILVVDDEAPIRQVVGLLLTQAGYEVILAEFGQIGYSKAQSLQPNLILLDLMMPVMDGFEVMRRLKDDQSTGHIPVIILTAKIDSASERECMRLGSVDYIKKPWGPRELEDRIGMALGYPKLDPPSGIPTYESLVGEEEDNKQNPDLRRSPESCAHRPSVEPGPQEPEDLDAGQPRKFRTRIFRVQPDGVDPASLI